MSSCLLLVRALVQFLFYFPYVLNGSGDVVHVSSEDRINLYPAAPIRLATMLNAWTIAWLDGANLLTGTLAKQTSSHTSDPPTLLVAGR